MRIQVFVFAWQGQWSNARALEAVAQKSGIDLRVIASGDPGFGTNWVVLDKDAHFGDQFREALKLFDGDVLLHIQADVMVPDMPRLVLRAQEQFANPRIGIWAPDVKYTTWTSSRSSLGTRLAAENDLDPRLEPVINTDCLCWALRGSVADALRSTPLTISHYGWGLDLAAAALCHLQNMIVVRDCFMRVSHPRGTGYAAEAAAEECHRYFASLTPELQGAINLLRLSSQALASRDEDRLLPRVRRAASRLLRQR